MDYEVIRPYIEKGLISEQAHPEDPAVRIFNYTQKCQFGQEWDDITRQCRGLIINVKTGEIIARPFPKFFNYQEHVDKGWPVPQSAPVVYEKFDGSLGILYQLNGKPWIATRGSFTSDQALWATDHYRRTIGKDAPADATVLFEIIYPENRIVVSYDFSGLVYLTALDIKSGLSIGGWAELFERSAKKIPYTNLQALLEMDQPNSEGFVLFYPSENVRMKIKFAEYVRLHKLVTGVSEIAIWEHMRDDKEFDDLLNKVPDEFFKWVTSVQTRLLDQFKDIELDARGAYLKAAEFESRKDQAAAIQERTKYPGVAFAMLDGKPYRRIIWQMLRPKGGRAFKTDIDV